MARTLPPPAAAAAAATACRDIDLSRLPPAAAAHGDIMETFMEEGIQWPVVTVLLSLPLLWISVRGDFGTLKFYLRYFAYIFCVSVAGLICIPLFLLRPWNVDNLTDVSKVLKYISKLIGITWEMRDCHHLKENKVGVIVSNHQTILDILGMFNLWETMGRCTVIARRAVFWVWPFGLAAWLAGLIFIDRGNPEQARKQINIATDTLKAKKIKLWVFPEGTRNKDRRSLLPFKKGAFHSAIRMQVPLIPVVYSPYYFLNVQKKFFDDGRVIIKTLPPIPTAGLKPEDIDSLVQTTHELMSQEYKKLSGEVLSQLPTNYPGLCY
ncbi:1-acyl-sn-glycerol-3-phosphate acyltransferase alpha isoform X1 [Schistocerca cancellata]|uniref:1-acyl-sn-glycerol-3-phosphate acyltransferase alpha isoform X1 n=2 Tax=Schistocerca cancellata TaxID=274614 RepID=UPI0021188E8A|nr:1-acyl-sn-glycerol-3-phosphate acyltransferase alpha isoform X1 [Schistocerca cancellata]